MVTRIFIAVLLAMAALGCRDEGKQIVIVHLVQMRIDVIETLARKERPEAFEQAVLRAITTQSDCGSILVARDVQGRDGDPLKDLLRRPHWDLIVAWTAEDERQSWVLATDGYRVLREGTGSAQDIGRAVCLQSREAEGDGSGRVSAR
jgi:hypothetical protein